MEIIKLVLNLARCLAFVQNVEGSKQELLSVAVAHQVCNPFSYSEYSLYETASASFHLLNHAPTY